MEPIIKPNVALILTETMAQLTPEQRSVLDIFLYSARCAFKASGVSTPIAINNLQLIARGLIEDLDLDDVSDKECFIDHRRGYAALI